jgi:hypothetical protein
VAPFAAKLRQSLIWEGLTEVQTMLKLTSILLCCGLACSASITTANATTTYTYTGHPFDVFFPDYTASDFVSGSFTLSSPLPSDQPATTLVTPISFSFTDGLQTVTQANVIASFTTFDIGTDSSGNINLWDVTVFNSNCPITSACEISTQRDMAGAEDQVNFNPGVGLGFTPGVWTTTPLPAALPLFATGLGALGLLGWRRKRKAAALAA